MYLSSEKSALDSGSVNIVDMLALESKCWGTVIRGRLLSIRIQSYQIFGGFDWELMSIPYLQGLIDWWVRVQGVCFPGIDTYHMAFLHYYTNLGDLG